MDNIWRNGFMGLAEVYKKQFFATDTEEYFKWVANNQAMLSCMGEMYGIMVSENRIVKIEDLSADEKGLLWEEVKRIAGGECSKEHALRICKALHFLGTLIQE
jgi:hypothetical protein